MLPDIAAALSAEFSEVSEPMCSGFARVRSNTIFPGSMPNVQVYFCDPRSPWQRGSNERGTDFSRISQSYLNSVALRLNQRPRKTLGFETPADKLGEVLH